ALSNRLSTEMLFSSSQAVVYGVPAAPPSARRSDPLRPGRPVVQPTSRPAVQPSSRPAVHAV
ncbi:hypothetical protein ACFT7U_09415, partial [Streptomyces rochei]|uniref:hypothetical protein n=1 Tax=Streptomyces rochei TaxID=1928 RepID=UPI00362ED189